jgi:lipopolysaccharide export system protein LptA
MTLNKLLTGIFFLTSFSLAFAEDVAVSNAEAKNENAPTYISATALVVDNQNRTFRYSGNVTVKRGELNITSKTLDGSYDEKNELKELIAKGDVYITSSGGITASSQQANYDAKSEIMTLTISPELQQNGSILTADVIRLYVKEDRSEADGEVRVRMPEGNDQKS